MEAYDTSRFTTRNMSINIQWISGSELWSPKRKQIANPQVSALVSRPVSNRRDIMCQSHGNNFTTTFHILAKLIAWITLDLYVYYIYIIFNIFCLMAFGLPSSINGHHCRVFHLKMYSPNTKLTRLHVSNNSTPNSWSRIGMIMWITITFINRSI